MRVNHSGEVAAQGLYQGHAAVARNPSIEEQMQRAATRNSTTSRGVKNASRARGVTEPTEPALVCRCVTRSAPRAVHWAIVGASDSSPKRRSRSANISRAISTACRRTTIAAAQSSNHARGRSRARRKCDRGRRRELPQFAGKGSDEIDGENHDAYGILVLIRVFCSGFQLKHGLSLPFFANCIKRGSA